MRSKMAKLKNRHKHKGFRFSVNRERNEIGTVFGTNRKGTYPLIVRIVQQLCLIQIYP